MTDPFKPASTNLVKGTQEALRDAESRERGQITVQLWRRLKRSPTHAEIDAELKRLKEGITMSAVTRTIEGIEFRFDAYTGKNCYSHDYSRFVEIEDALKFEESCATGGGHGAEDYRISKTEIVRKVRLGVLAKGYLRLIVTD